MKRIIEEQLLKWKGNSKRKPLIIDGARQIGKTYSILDFGKSHYPGTAYFNFDGNQRLKDIFAEDLMPDRIIRELIAYSGKSIQKETTLIIFDEIQACPAALASLKYFCEQAREYHIVCAGSLLGVTLNREAVRDKKINKAKTDGNTETVSFPVGKVDRLKMFPMNFKEFLWALGFDSLVIMIEEAFAADKPLSAALHNKALELYRTFLYVGGMPDCVSDYVSRNDFDFVRAAQHAIVADYTADMAKYSTEKEAIKHEAVYNSITSQLAKENKKFQYSIIKSGARAKEYEDSVTWLQKAGIILQCFKADKEKLPSEFYKDLLSYKVYYSDVGLLCSKFAVSPEMVLSNLNFGGEARGALTENYLAQELVAAGHNIYYWESDGIAEIDFLLQLQNRLVPVECKAADNTRSRSLKSFVEIYRPDYSLRVSAKNFGFENGIKSVPLYSVFCIKP